MYLVASPYRARHTPAAGENRRLTGAAYEFQSMRQKTASSTNLPQFPAPHPGASHPPPHQPAASPRSGNPGAGDFFFQGSYWRVRGVSPATSEEDSNATSVEALCDTDLLSES